MSKGSFATQDGDAGGTPVASHFFASRTPFAAASSTDSGITTHRHCHPHGGQNRCQMAPSRR